LTWLGTVVEGCSANKSVCNRLFYVTTVNSVKVLVIMSQMMRGGLYNTYDESVAYNESASSTHDSFEQIFFSTLSYSIGLFLLRLLQ
jgi:hypothetical protein